MAKAMEGEFEERIARFLTDRKLLDDSASLQSKRFLSRSVAPHVEKLSSLFNRAEAESQGDGLAPYWKASSHPENLRLAYFLAFMPCNIYRVASVWTELARLGYRWPSTGFRGIEFGAGPASGACGIALGESHAPSGLPSEGNWALIEQDKAVLELGTAWAPEFFRDVLRADWGIRPFHRKIDLSRGEFLPASAPSFHLWLSSYYLNESGLAPRELAAKLLHAWDKHLENEGLVILVEPALKRQSRRLLELRQEILTQIKQPKNNDKEMMQVLLPCLGHQACGALAEPEDWCHEEVSWWRPRYMRHLDEMTGLDRKTLPFSYLVLTKSKRTCEEILPALAKFKTETRHRLVSPAHSEGKEREFYLCGSDGKKRARYRPPTDDESSELQRGDILLGCEMRGDRNSTRIDHIIQRVPE